MYANDMKVEMASLAKVTKFRQYMLFTFYIMWRQLVWQVIEPSNVTTHSKNQSMHHMRNFLCKKIVIGDILIPLINDDGKISSQ